MRGGSAPGSRGRRGCRDGRPPASHGRWSEPAPDPDRRTAFWGAPRAPLTLALSDDDGRTWPLAYDIENGDGYCLTNNSRDGLNRELSYPSVLGDGVGGLHVAYTWHRRAIKHVHLDAALVDRLRVERPTSAGPQLTAP